MVSLEIKNETLHNEATVAPERSEEVRQDQHTTDHSQETQNLKGNNMGEQQAKDQSTEAKSTRKPYDGSKPHGVVPAKLENVEAATKAKKRLQMRLEYLNKEYANCVEIIQDPDKSISEKAPKVDLSKKINIQLKKLQEVANELKARVPELEELVKDSVLNFDPATKVEVTI